MSKLWVDCSFPSESNFATLAKLFSQLLTDILLIGKQKLNVTTLQAFHELRVALFTDASCFVNLYTSIPGLQGPNFGRKYFACNVIQKIEQTLVHEFTESTRTQFAHCSFVFLCCIKNFHKDMRRILFDYACKANATALNDRLKRFEEVKRRYCSNKVSIY